MSVGDWYLRLKFLGAVCKWEQVSDKGRLRNFGCDLQSLNDFVWNNLLQLAFIYRTAFACTCKLSHICIYIVFHINKLQSLVIVYIYLLYLVIVYVREFSWMSHMKICVRLLLMMWRILRRLWGKLQLKPWRKPSVVTPSSSRPPSSNSRRNIKISSM